MTFPIPTFPSCLFISAAAIVLSISCHEERNYHYPSDLEENLINGPVVRMHTLCYEIIDSAGSEKLIQENIELFNERGSSPSDTVNYPATGDQEINLLYFNPNSSMKEKHTLINGKLDAVIRLTYSSAGRFERGDFLNGKDSLLEYYVNDRLTSKGMVDSGRHFDGNNVLLESFTNRHSQFTRVHAINFDTTGQVIYQDSVEVNEFNWPLREFNWFRTGEKIIRDTIVHQYDSLDRYGNWKIHTIKSRHRSPVRFIRTYIYQSSGF